MPSPSGSARTSTVVARPTLLWVALAIIYVVWGSTYLAIRVTVETVPPFLSAAARFGFAAVIMAASMRARRGRGALRVDRRAIGGAALVGVLLLAGGNGLVVFAESGRPGVAVPSGVAALLIALVPVFIVVFRAVTGDKPRVATVVGVVLGFAGLALLVLPAGGVPAAPLAGGLLVVLAAGSWSLGSFVTARVPMPADPFVATVYEMFAGAAVLIAIGLIRGENRDLDLGAISARSWIALAYLLVVGSLVAFTAYVWLLQNAPISLAATYAYVNPVVAVLLGALVLAEPITTRVLIGGAVIVVAVAVVVSVERTRRPADRPSDRASDQV